MSDENKEVFEWTIMVVEKDFRDGHYIEAEPRVIKVRSPFPEQDALCRACERLEGIGGKVMRSKCVSPSTGKVVTWPEYMPEGTSWTGHVYDCTVLDCAEVQP